VLGVLALSVSAAGCGGGGGDDPRQADAVKAVVVRWLNAQADGDGKAVCALVTGEALAADLRMARRLGRHVTCAQAESAHPPGIDPTQLPAVILARRQARRGLQIESVKVGGNRAVVTYSWQVPKHPSPALAFKRPAHGDRVQTTVPLHRLGAQWKIG
jgi:ketosteroid isomerase-like protein